ncbi:hypothetical protein DFH09DRAFT_1082058 [Mycena vulgaris]|nr:hypothetical protein DFH09DRAFT_1082058 [Mycena vulgaris]
MRYGIREVEGERRQGLTGTEISGSRLGDWDGMTWESGIDEEESGVDYARRGLAKRYGGGGGAVDRGWRSTLRGFSTKQTRRVARGRDGNARATEEWGKGGRRRHGGVEWAVDKGGHDMRRWRVATACVRVGGTRHVRVDSWMGDGVGGLDGAVHHAP